MNRMFVIGSAVLIALAAAHPARSQRDDPFAGTWKLNLEKSKYNAGTPPKSEVRNYEALDNGERLTVNSVAADGSRVEWGYTVQFDGQYYPITGSGPADAIAVKLVSARRVEASLRKNGKVIETANRVVSDDGKTMTATARVAGTNGAPLFVIVYDRQ